MFPTLELEEFLTSEGYSGQLNEALHQFLEDQGLSGQLNEMLYEWLGQLGYTGTLNERVYQWRQGGMVGPMAPVLTGGSLSLDGTTVDITPPTVQGVPAPDVVFVLTLDGNDITGQVVNNQVVGAAEGSYVATWTATNASGQDVATDTLAVSYTPVLSVTGGTITPFTREGTDYVEVLWRTSGSFNLSKDVSMAFAIGAGGGTGGRSNSYTWVSGGGGAGGCYSGGFAAFDAGDYSITIGAGAPASTSAGTSVNGSDTILSQIGVGDVVVPGGGAGASHGTNASPMDGGSGGGGRGGATGVGTPANGTIGFGTSGGAGLISAVVEEQAGGGGGGAGGAGGSASAGVAGVGGPGKLLNLIATPRTVSAGGAGCVYAAGDPVVSSPDEDWGNGSGGSQMGTAGAGGDGFMFLVVRANEVIVQ